MNQQQALQLFLPVLIVLPILYFRMRRTAKAQPLKLGRLWIRPALILVATGLVLFLPPPGQHVARHLATQDWMCLVLAAGLGGVAGWHWGRTMAIEVHPEDGTLMVSGGQMAILVLGVLILFRTGLRAGVEAEAATWHLDAVLISDALIVFSAALFTLRSIEMYIRAKRVIGAKV